MNAIPWYQSRVYVGAVVAIISQLLVLIGKQDVVPIEVITTNVEAAFQLVALGATLYAAWKRQTSAEQPLTLTKSGADRKTQSGFARPLMLAVLLAISVPAALSTFGCAAQQSVEVRFEQKLEATVDVHTAVTLGVASLLDAKVISGEDAKEYREIAQSARAVLNSADRLKDSDIRSAEAQVQLAQDILLELQAFLNERGDQQ